MNARLLKFWLNIWPPYLGAGIRVRHISSDWSEAVVSLRPGRLNRNHAGSHFGARFTR